MRISRRQLNELARLQRSMQELAAHRSSALRNFLASRYSTTVQGQREFWLEFAWADQEYSVAVRRLAQFCLGEAAPARRQGREPA